MCDFFVEVSIMNVWLFIFFYYTFMTFLLINVRLAWLTSCDQLVKSHKLTLIAVSKVNVWLFILFYYTFMTFFVISSLDSPAVTRVTRNVAIKLRAGPAILFSCILLVVKNTLKEIMFTLYIAVNFNYKFAIFIEKYIQFCEYIDFYETIFYSKSMWFYKHC